MKLACSSTAFDEQLRGGDLTQLEWIDACARELAADGAVFDVRHFPRTDTDYLAQVKKMAADLGLSVAALRHDGFFSSDAEHMEQAVEMAVALGAPLLAAPLPPATEADWNGVLGRLGEATTLAKRFNVTLALRNEPHTFAAGVHDMKRVTKEADSAWLRYGPDFDSLEQGSDPRELLPKTVLVWHEFERAFDGARELLGSYRGFLVLDASEGNATVQSMKKAVDRIWRLSHEI
ncbi:MAG TPA: TIM barrel protein [Candidatus Rubrimentiphilum sp.]|nr:TIM barrel protein [Candidatus Rubrimentiphilum sp.]